jgi:chemotaxis protein methyltransferase WspC
MTSFDRILKTLQHRLGLEPSSLGVTSLQNAVRKRMQVLGTAESDDYAAVLEVSGDEFRALADLIAVPETWFFRDQAPFELLATWATRWRADGSLRLPVRALSAGCSTGEETYSIAAVLRSAGFTNREIDVLGIDISERALNVAREGSYRKRILRRGIEPQYRAWFDQQPDGAVRVIPELQESVRFERGNLADGNADFARHTFDVAFCRNVLIYQNESGRDRIFRNLAQCLSQEGLLVVGHAEPLRVPRTLFHPTGPPRAYAFCPGPERTLLKMAARPALVPRPKVISKIDWGPAETSSPPNGNALEEARILADRGLLDAAARICYQKLESGTVEPEAYFLLGTIVQAQGGAQHAEELYAKAIYLDANHEAALRQLALISEGRGDQRGARIYRRRADRASKPEAGA